MSEYVSCLVILVQEVMLKMITMFADGREVGIKFAHWQVQSSCSVLKCTLPEACS